MTEQPTRDQLRALADAATPGPWVVTKCEPCAKRGREDIQIWDERGYIPIAQWMDEVDPDAGEDAEFIAAARTAVPQLLDQLEQAEAELDSWMTRAYGAEQRAWRAEARIAEEKRLRMKATAAATKAEARIEAVRDLCDAREDPDQWPPRQRLHGGAVMPASLMVRDIRRALDGAT